MPEPVAATLPGGVRFRLSSSDSFSTVKITCLMENTGVCGGCVPLHGLSLHVETRERRILFDAGPSDETLRNAVKLGIDLGKVDVAVLSHGHYDHSGGFASFAALDPSAEIFMQRAAAGEHYGFDGPENGYHYIGIGRSLPALPQARLLDGDAVIGEGLALFTVEKRVYPVPSANRRIVRKNGETYVEDDFAHEQSLFIETGGARVLLSGCAHNGISNILEEFIRKFGRGRFPQTVVSGFHLLKKSGYTEDDFAEHDEIAHRLLSYPCTFYTCHCTGTEPYARMKRIMGEKLRYIRTGDRIEA